MQHDIPWVLDHLHWMRCWTTCWIDPRLLLPPAGHPGIRFLFTNYGVSLRLQTASVWDDRVERLNTFFAGYRSGDEYDTEAITHVMHFPGAMLPGGVRAAVVV